MQEFPLAVPGVASTDDWGTVSSPFDGRELGRIERIDGEGVEAALTLAHQLFRDKSAWLPAQQRVSILERAAEIMTERREQLAQLALSEGGKPLVDSRVEVDRAIDGVKNCAECIRSEGGHEVPMRLNAGSANRIAFTTKEPIGVVVAVSAFNHPLNLIVHQVAPAVATGCPVIVKPAADTALSCFAFIEILREAGLPDQWAMPVLTQDHQTAERLVTDRRVGFFSFIGSAAVGWALRFKLAPGARCALEHGGVAPVIVAEDADLKATLASVAKGGFYHAGQVCVSVQRVYVHESIARNFAQQLGEIASRLVVGDPGDEATEVGPLIRAKETQRIGDWVDEAVAEGAELIVGGQAISSAFYQPTVLLNPAEYSKVSRQEIFGPVVCVYSYADIDDALARANALDVAFQGAVYTQNIDTAMRVQRNLDAAAVMVNDHSAFRVDWMPFAGLRQSGHGVGGIPYTFEEMQVEKLLVIKSQYL